MPATALHTNGTHQGPIHIEQEYRALAEPGYRIIRRNGTVTPFDATKITLALTKAFLAVEGSMRLLLREALSFGCRIRRGGSPFPWISEPTDLKKERNVFETRIVQHRNGGALA